MHRNGFKCPKMPYLLETRVNIYKHSVQRLPINHRKQFRIGPFKTGKPILIVFQIQSRYKIFLKLEYILVKLQNDIDLKLFHINLDTYRFDRHIFSSTIYF